MECYNCGYKLEAGAERCPRCGQRFKPREQADQPAAKPSLFARIKDLFGKGSQAQPGHRLADYRLGSGTG